MHIRMLQPLIDKIPSEPDYRHYTRMPVQHACLLSGSLIDTPAGLQPVDCLRPGDHVWGFDHEHKLSARILKVYRAESAVPGLSGHRLNEQTIVSANTCLYWQGQWTRADRIPLAAADFSGPVYDLLTDTHNFYCQGTLIGLPDMHQPTEDFTGGLQ